MTKKKINRKELEKELRNYKKVKKIIEPFLPTPSTDPKKRDFSNWLSSAENKPKLFNKPEQ